MWLAPGDDRHLDFPLCESELQQWNDFSCVLFVCLETDFIKIIPLSISTCLIDGTQWSTLKSTSTIPVFPYHGRDKCYKSLENQRWTDTNTKSLRVMPKYHCFFKHMQSGDSSDNASSSATDGREAGPGQNTSSSPAVTAEPPDKHRRRTGFDPTWLSERKYSSWFYKTDTCEVSCKSQRWKNQFHLFFFGFSSSAVKSCCFSLSCIMVTWICLSFGQLVG